MASFAYTNLKRALWAGEINWATGDFRVALVMTNTTCDTEKDKVTFAGFTTIDEFDGANYSTPGLALVNEAINQDDPNLRAEVDADNLTFNSGQFYLPTYSLLDVAGDLVLTNGADLYVYAGATNGTWPTYGVLVSVGGTMDMYSGSTVYVYSASSITTSAPPERGSALFEVGNLTVRSGSSFNADYNGYAGGNGMC